MRNKKNFNQEILPNGKKALKFYPLFKAWTQKVGFNSDILLYHYYKGAEDKIVSRYGAEKGGFTFKEGIKMMKDIMSYQKELKRYFVPLPPTDDIILEYHPLKKRAIVVKSELWTGNDISKIIEQSKSKEEIKKIVIKMCDIIIPICRKRFNGLKTRVGIDPRPANFTIDDDGKMWFVDIFPPRFRKKGKPFVEWPSPKNKIGRDLGYFKHFDIRGIMLCATAQLARAKPELKEFFERIVFGEFKKIFSKTEYKNFLLELKIAPWIKLREITGKADFSKKDLDEAKNIILTFQKNKIFDVDYNIYTLREIALEFAFREIITKDDLEDFFKKSHFEDKISPKIIKKLKNKLIIFLNKAKFNKIL